MMLTRFSRVLAPLNSRQLSCTPTATVLGAVSADGVGRVTIVNPAKRNAMTLGMYQQVPAAVSSATPSGTRVTVLTGAGAPHLLLCSPPPSSAPPALPSARAPVPTPSSPVPTHSSPSATRELYRRPSIRRWQ